MTAIDEFEFQATRVLNEAAASQLPGSFRKVLYVVMLDALAARRFPDVKKNGKRFIRFIRVCGDWPDGERVSLPVAATDDQLDPALRSFVRDRLLGWEDAICGIGNDPLPKDLPAGNLKPFRSCQHVRLLWRF